MRSRLSTLALLAVLASAGIGCATYSDDLNRGIRYYDANEHERSLAVLRSLERDIDSLSAADRIRYYYYRGMTDYRLASDSYKVRPDARHWLGLAKAASVDLPDALTEEQKSRLQEALDDLNRDVYGGADTTADEKSDEKKSDKKADKKKSDDSGDTDEKPTKKKKKKSEDLGSGGRGRNFSAPSSVGSRQCASLRSCSPPSSRSARSHARRPRAQLPPRRPTRPPPSR